ncbi:hypothetical protein KKG31_00370 [Patescibacteria group bacterium]|nr:hypothetical protein [Patescibacteria group bacterium]MBU1757644.1 hypothetical protein [Patescibacteria group bacterium]
MLILAVRPQDFLDLDFSVFTQIKTVCSVMAGISVSKIQEQTGVKNIIRTMPNLALSVGRGVTGVLEVGTISAEISEVINGTFSKVGKVVKLKDEDQIDHITAMA